MKKTIRFIALILVMATLLGICSLFSGCTSSKLVGTWELTGPFPNGYYKYEFTFNAGGKGKVKTSDHESAFHWSLNGEKLKIKWYDSGETMNFIIKIDGDTFTLENINGEVSEFKRS
ncbi:MAG: lipocalin family protein [Clostridia bacterium]|nr:lipocalin family protein [Clostridia bacterium]